MSKIPNDKFNEFAMSRFEAVKERMKFSLGIEAVKVIAKQNGVKPLTINQDKIDEMLKVPSNKLTNDERDQLHGLINVSNLVDKTFDFINGLDLPPNLAMAIGLIISGAKTGNREDLKKAIDALDGGFLNANQS